MSNTESLHTRRQIERDGARFTLLGTAHVSRASAEEVSQLIHSGEFDAVAVELCPSRHRALVDPEQLAKLDLFQVIKSGKAGLVAVQLALGAYQQRLAEQFGIEPGQEMRAAIAAADEHALPLWIIDRDIGVTLKRVYRRVPWWQRFGLFGGLIASVMSREKVSEEDIERLKEGDMLESTFAEFAEQSEGMYEALIAERDAYMAYRLREEKAQSEAKNILVVIGAGHLAGMAEHLRDDQAEPATERQALEHVPPGKSWLKWIPWLIVAVVLSGFAYGFSQSRETGIDVVLTWVLINGGLSALGTLLALGHPLSIVTAFVAAPLTSLNPTIGAGFVVAGAELAFRKPTVKDFGNLRHDVARLTGWWRNRVARTLLVFIFATIGSAVGTYVAGFKIIDQLFGG